MADPYSILGISKGADEKEIKSAYRKLAKKYHPDYNTSNPKAAERFSEITKAYDLLSDSDQRARYDRGEIDIDGNPQMPFGFGKGGSQYGGTRSNTSGQGGFGGFGNEGMDFANIFDDLFGGVGGGQQSQSPFGQRGHARPAKGANKAYTLPIDFVDAALLTPQRITLDDGQTLDVKLPKGVEDGTQMRLTGKGARGAGGNGDAIVTISVMKHPYYSREGHNILLDLPISLSEAVLGGKVRVPTADGAVMMTIPKNSNSGKHLRIKGRGFHDKNGKRGDQIVTLQIMLPDEADAELQQFASSWKHRDYDPRKALDNI